MGIGRDGGERVTATPLVRHLQEKEDAAASSNTVNVILPEQGINGAGLKLYEHEQVGTYSSVISVLQ